MADKYEKKRDTILADFQSLLDDLGKGNNIAVELMNVLDKTYYDQDREGKIQNVSDWKFPPCKLETKMQWLRIEQLPTGLTDGEDHYRAKERMQGMLNSLRGIYDKLAFLLVRNRSITSLFLGVPQDNNSGNNIEVFQKLTQVNMPGMQTVPVKDDRELDLNSFENVGVMTGQPSIRWDERENPLQTLDRLTTGLRVATGTEDNYALLIIAESAKDRDVRDIIDRIQKLKTDLSEYRKYTVSRTVTQNSGKSKSQSIGLNFGGMLLMLALTAAAVGTGFGAVTPLLINQVNTVINKPGGTPGSALGSVLGIRTNVSKQYNEGFSDAAGISSEHVNYQVDYCMSLLDKVIARMEAGRNQGFWNTGVYILADSASAVDMVSSIARSVYAGQDTHLEPLRIFNFGKSVTVWDYAYKMQLLPLPVNEEFKKLNRVVSEEESWHVFGKLYEGMSTPVNTEELSIMMSLPRKDVAGISIKDDAVEFASNPPDMLGRGIHLGDILDMGVRNGHQFLMDMDQLNSHGLIVGANGGGKSVTSRQILNGVMSNGVPVLVIDPVKTDYLYWADAYNKKHRGDKDFRPIHIYAPGLKYIPGLETPIEELQLNPFKPCSGKGLPINVMGHTSALLGLLRAVLAMGDFLPMLMEEAVYNYLTDFLGSDVVEGASVDPDSVQEFPTFSGLKAQVDNLLRDRQYSKENTDNFKAAFETRINNLTRGWKKSFFESEKTTDGETLFENNTVICLAGVTDNRDKAFLMSLLLLALNEYRSSRYLYDTDYRKSVALGRKGGHGSYLAHYTVVEEAHRILQNTSGCVNSENAQTVVAESFCEMLSEIRETGEGLMIIDQYPSRLIPDAIKNTNLKIIHRLLAEDDRHAVASCMSLKEDQNQLLASLKKGDAIIHSGQSTTARWIHVNYQEG